MAMLLSFPAPAPMANRAVRAASGTAEIIILPCIRRERIEIDPADFASTVAPIQSPRQASVS